MNTRHNRLLAGLLAFIMIISVLPVSAFAAEADLTVSTPEELQNFASDVNGGNSYEGKTVVLAGDISLGGEANPWTAIGTQSAPFKGTFDGGNHVISGLYINSTKSHQGLFGYINGGTVQNVTVQGSVTSTGGNIAGVAGYNNKGIIKNCSSAVDVNGKGGSFVHYYGGIAAYNNGTVTGCVNSGSIAATGGAACGGIVGCNFGGTVADCYNKGTVQNPGSHVGGIIGQGRNGSEVANCYNIGSVTGKTNVGAIAGQAQDGAASCQNSYYLAGSASFGIGSLSNTDGVMPEEAMKAQEFADKLGDAFMSDKDGINGGYPVLAWQELIPDLIIGSYEQLKAFADDVNSGNTYEGKLVRLDVNVFFGKEANPWTAIGTQSAPFKGTFDGNGHVVSGLYINSKSSYQGLFGYINGGTVQNVAVQGSVTSAGGNIAGVVGYNNKGTIKNCSNAVDVNGTGGSFVHYYGGIAAYSSGTVTGCVNSGSITATGGAACGGIIGCNFGGSVTDCYNKGTVENPGSHVGGIVGQGRNGASIANCYNIGSVTGKTNVGAVVGQAQDGAASCQNSYYLTGSASFGIGSLSNTDGVMPEEAMKAQELADKLGDAFMSDKDGINDGYPVLVWENSVSTDKPVRPAFAESTELSAALAEYIREAVNSTKSHKLSSSGTLLGDKGYMAGASSTDTDWMALTMGRFGIFEAGDDSYSFRIDDGGYDSYINAMRSYIEKTYSENGGILHSAKATEWYRAAITVAALGGDPTSFGTYNGKPIDLIADGSYNCALRNGPGTQGINGWIWGLIALDAGCYDVPEDAKYTRENFITEILKMQLTDGAGGNEYGGWVLGGYGNSSDVDITAMAIQALAPYYNDDTVYTYTNEISKKTVSKTVRRCVDEALERLSAMMSGNGGFTSWGTNNAESIAQVIVALCSLGIDPAEDTRFITANGKTLLDGLLDFRTSDGGFCHIAGSGWNSMANDQAAYALVSYWRFENGMRSLYDMRPNFTDEARVAIDTAVGMIDRLPDPSADNYKSALKSALAAFREVPESERRYVGNYAQLAAAIELVGGETELDTDVPYITSVAVTQKPVKVKYYDRENFDPAGMTVTAIYSDGKREAVSGYTYSPVGALTLSDTKIYITYGILKTSLDITVSEKMPWDGEGTEENPYLIRSADDLADMYTYITAKQMPTSGVHFRMTQDINMKNIENWRGIAESTSKGFCGHFDGAGYAVWNLNHTSNYNVLGLFGNLGDGALIENLTVASGKIGVPGGYNNTVGGIAARVVSNASATIRNCHNYASVSGLWGVGGILGELEDNAHVTVENCSNRGEVYASYTGGGIIGQVGPNRWKNNGSSVTVVNCYNVGNIGGTGAWGLGGIIGSFRLGNTDDSAVKNCYNAGTVRETEPSGAVIGSVCETSVLLENVYYLNSSCDKAVGMFDDGGNDTPGTVTGEAAAKTEAEMKEASFSALLGDAFAADAQTVGGGYPVLKVQKPIGEEAPVRAGLEIGTAEELIAFAERVNKGERFTGKTVALTAHIDLSDVDNWIPIGRSGNYSFDGIFDGRNCVIDNLYSVSGGLFGYVGSNAVIKNVGVASGEIGKAENYTQFLGGIANWSNGADFIGCWNGADIYCAGYSGGIVGTVRDGGESLIRECYNVGTVYGKDTHVGGIVGHLDTTREQEGTEVNVTVENCYNTGTVYASGSAGGIAGGIQDGHTVRGCYNAGDVYASSESLPIAGSVVGSVTRANTFEKCYYDVSTCEKGIGELDSGEIIGMTADEMRSSDFAELLGGSFTEDPYGLANGGYPIFSWQSTYDADDINYVVEKIGAIGVVTPDSADAVNAARNAYDDLDSSLKSYVSNYSVLQQAETELAAVQVLRQVKDTAKTQLESYKDFEDYRDAQQEELKQIIADGKISIENASDEESALQVLAEAKADMDTVKTDKQLTDEEAIASVSGLIAAIGVVTPDSADAVNAARNAYDNLDGSLKSYVSNYSVLQQAETELAAMQTLRQVKDTAKAQLESYKDFADYREAQQEELKQIIADGKISIENASDAESALQILAEAKADMDKVKTEKQLTDEEAVASVSGLIEAIGTVTLQSADAVKAARNAYDGLDDSLKSHVSNYIVLNQAEAKLAYLQTVSQAQSVSELINSIGTVTLESESVIAAARVAYDSLSDEAKALVEGLNVLESAEKALADLKNAVNDPDDTKLGDINGDGMVNSKDLTRLMKLISGEKVEVFGTPDINGDEAVNSKDLTRLMKIISGALSA